MICSKRFHFVLPSKGCKPNIQSLSSKGSEKASTGSKLMDSKCYLMHGVVHSNGFGHLITINGIEGGSEFLAGHEIMDFWDRICTALQLRQVSITDATKKGSMELRLLHGLAYGHPWFTNWGYTLTRGTYGVIPHTYRQSLDSLRSLPLFLLTPLFSPQLPTIITKYQTLSSPHTLLTLSHLTRFILQLIRSLPPTPTPPIPDNPLTTPSPSCRWSSKRVDMAAHVIVSALKNSGPRWVTRQEVRDAARAHIGDTGLLDYVLKSLANHVIGTHVVRRSVNPITKVLEYSLQDAAPTSFSSSALCSVQFQLTRAQLMRDLSYVYKHVLAYNTIAGVVLDAKHLVKDYGEAAMGNINSNDASDFLKIMCTVRVVSTGADKQLPNCEMLVLPPDAKVGDLKREVERRFKEVYLGLKNFFAEKIVGIDVEDSEFVVGVVEVGGGVVVEGRVGCEGKEEEEIYEGGNGQRVVDCMCGAKEEDGEQMVCCDICEVWQHTRCVGAADGEAPRLFLCGQCENNIAALPSIQY